MMMMMMMMMMMKRLCSIEHSSYDNYFFENNSLFESFYGKNHVDKIKDLFTVTPVEDIALTFISC